MMPLFRKSEKNGLWLLAPKDADSEGCIDVFAIHGLGGDKFGTWTEHGKMWLRDFLPEQLPEARIFTYGYDSTVAFSKSSAEVDDFARDFLHRVKSVRFSDIERVRPILFICHSLGGILFKQVLSISHGEPKYRELLINFFGVVFMGTPHGGSDIAFWASYAGRLLNGVSLGTRTNKDLLHVLHTDSSFLGLLSQKFKIQCLSLRIISFYETEKFPMLNCRIVEKESAHLNLSNETLLPVQADHRAICRFADAKSQKYISVSSAIVDMVREIGRTDLSVDPPFARYRAALNEWLNPVPQIDEYNRKRSLRLENTCEWVEQRKMFQDWRDSIRADTFLWIKGPPGCGKSTVATRVIELLKAEKPTAYFFCDLEDPKRRDFDQILKTWTWQLLLQKRYLADHVFDIYLETVGTETPIESFQRALEYLVKNGDPCYLVVDGLDECHASSFEMQRTLWKLMDHAKILVISRWEYWIVQGFPLGEMTRTIEVLPADTSKDLERYICKRVQELRLDIKTAEKVANVLVAGAQGMFLWAQLITEYLSQQVTLNDTLMALEDLPDGLEALYDRLSRRIKSLPPSRFKIALKLLQWTFSGLRQLSLQELAVALAIEPGEDRLNPRNSVIDLRTFVRESCCSLLEVDEARNIIRFVHSSALEFFKRAGKHRQNSKFMGSNDPAFIATTSSFYCAAICLTYLSYDDINFVPEDIDPLVYSDNLKVHLDQHVFLEYCALNWWKHLPILGTESDGDEEILSRSIKIFTSSQRSLVRWLQLFQMLDGFKNDESLQASLFRSSESPYSSSFMHNSSFFHHFWLAPSRLFTRWQRWKTESFFKSRGFFTPIGIASFFDFVDVVKSEHESGKSIDARDACGLTSLMLAAHGESPSTLQYAIKNGANVRLATCYGYGVARYASRNCISVLPQVLQAGALISPATLDDGRNALHSASASVGFHPFVIQELLKYCTVEDLNAKDFWGKTALHYVAAIDIEPYVKLTMGRFSATGGVPLKQRQIHIASREEAFTPSSRIEIEAWITAWGSLLSEADSTLLAGEINEKNVSMIVQKIKTTMILWLGNRGASVNEKDNLGQIPLDLALKTGFAEYLSITDVLGVDRVSKALLALGYGTSDGDPSNRRLALDEAVVRGHLITVKALLALNTTSSILSTAEKESILSMIKHKESAPHPRTRLKAVFSKPQASYQPETSLEVSRTSLILQFCLKRSSCGFRYAESDCDRLVTRVLDFAEYWVRSTSEIGTEDNANGVGHALNQDLSARITMNTGQLRKIEIYLAPSQFIMHRLTSYHSSFPNNSRSKEDDGEFHAKYSSHEPKLNLSILSPRRSSRVPSSNSQSLWQKSNVQRAPTLEIMRRSNILSENSSSEWLKDVLKDGAKIPVPFEMFQWVKHTFGADHHPLLRQHIVGMQTWSLPFDPENAASMTDLQRQQIERWLTSFSKGDEIILQPTHEFFAQDIALYSGFALAVYTA